MKKKVLFSLLALALVAVPLFSVSASAAHFPPPGPAIDPIVSTGWLESNLGTPDLVVLDVRSEGEYGAGHIPGAINVPIAFPVSAWTALRDGIFYEVPPTDELLATIGDAGISGDSRVVVVGRTAGELAVYAMADATRVGITLIYAGVKNVAILDGGQDKWAAEGKTVSTDPVTPTPVTYTGKVNTAMFVSKDYVTRKMRRVTILDGRDPEFYFGIGMEPFYTREGHIPGATCLPAPYFWTFTDGIGTYKDAAVLKDMASGAVGKCMFPREIIVYCGVGGYASTLWFVLSEVAGYKNVEVFDGSAQEWTADPNAPVVVYKWE